jgi:hypothetical protein
MKIAIVQLSDIHLSTERYPQNPIMERVEALNSAISSLFLSDLSACILLINGDIAYSGLRAEYQLGHTLLSEIRKHLIKSFGQDMYYSVILPGNHDCDFSRDNAARKTLIEDIPTDAFDDGSILDICTKPQDEFFSFCSTFQGQSSTSTGIQRVFDIHTINAGSETITIRVLNTAWGSRLKEKPNTLPMPVKTLKTLLLGDSKGTLVITALHHPYSWLHSDVSRDIRSVIEETSDLIFTGHEHVNESYSKTKHSGEHNEYIEAGPLQENGSPEESEFNVVVVDTKSCEYFVHHFAWIDNFYQQVNETQPRPFIRNNSRLRHEFALNTAFEDELDDTDVEYHHPFQDVVRLKDIYLYPDLREFTFLRPGRRSEVNRDYGQHTKAVRSNLQRPNEEDFHRTTIRSRDVVNYILQKKYLIVSAPERCGRTAFSRILFKDLWRNGKVPLLLSCDGMDSKAFARIDKLLDKQFDRQYRSPKVTRYWNIGLERRVVIVDDFHKLPNISAMREKLIDELKKRFSIVVLVGGASLRFQELMSSGQTTNLLSDFVHTEFLPFGKKLRSQLIRRWFELGRQGTLPDDEVARQVATLEQIISSVLGRGPSSPISVIRFTTAAGARTSPTN